MLSDEVRTDSFADFVADCELRLRQALTASFGPDRGWEAAAEALAYGWENWDRVSVMENPVGYLYRVGKTRGSRIVQSRTALFPADVVDRMPWVEPGLPEAIRLPQKQREVVFLLYAYDWSMAEVAALLGVSKSTVQSYSDRAMRRLRRSLKVDL